MAESEDRVLRIRFVGDVGDLERQLDRVEQRASRVRIGSGGGGSSSLPSGHGSVSPAPGRLDDLFETRYENRLVRDMERQRRDMERAAARELRAAERAAAAEERRAASAEARVNRNWDAAQFSQFKAAERDAAFGRIIQPDSGGGGSGGGGRGMSSILNRIANRMLIGGAIYGGARLLEDYSKYQTASAVAGNDQAAQLKASLEYYQGTSASVPLLGFLASQFVDPGGTQQAKIESEINREKAVDEFMGVNRSIGASAIAEGRAANLASALPGYSRRSLAIQQNLQKAKEDARQDQNASDAAFRKTQDADRAQIEDTYKANLAAGWDSPQRLAQWHARVVGQLDSALAAHQRSSATVAAGRVASAQQISSAETRDLDREQNISLSGIQSQTAAVRYAMQQNSLASTLVQQWQAGGVALMNAQGAGQPIFDATAANNMAKMMSTVSAFMRQVGGAGATTIGDVRLNALLAAGDERGAGLQRIKNEWAAADREAGGGIGGLIQRGLNFANYTSQANLFNRTFDINQQAKDQQLQNSVNVDRLMAEGREKSARALEIQQAAKLSADTTMAQVASADHQSAAFKEAQKRARLQLQGGLYQEQNLQRELELTQYGGARSFQDIGPGGIGGGNRNGDRAKEDINKGMDAVRQAILDLKNALLGVQ